MNKKQNEKSIGKMKRYLIAYKVSEIGIRTFLFCKLSKKYPTRKELLAQIPFGSELVSISLCPEN